MSNIIPGLEPLAVPIDSVHPDPRNARAHPDANLEALKTSLEEYGQRKPIVVNADGTIEAGNGLWAAAKDLGWKEIAAVHVDDDAVHATAFGLMDNQSALLAEWDLPILKDLLQELDTGDIDMQDMTGFDAWELERLMTAIAPPEPPEPPGDGEGDEVRQVVCSECGHHFRPKRRRRNED